MESLDPWLSDAHADREDLFSENFQKRSNVKKVKIEDFDIYIYMSSVFNVLTRSSEKNFLCSNMFLDIKDQVEKIFRKKFFGVGVC